MMERAKKTEAELITLIDQRRDDWWPDHVELEIARSAEHEWIAVPVGDGPGGSFVASLNNVVAQLRTRYGWTGY